MNNKITIQDNLIVTIILNNINKIFDFEIDWIINELNAIITANDKLRRMEQ
jgi:hypothetical protein